LAVNWKCLKLLRFIIYSMGIESRNAHRINSICPPVEENVKAGGVANRARSFVAGEGVWKRMALLRVKARCHLTPHHAGPNHPRPIKTRRASSPRNLPPRNLPLDNFVVKPYSSPMTMTNGHAEIGQIGPVRRMPLGMDPLFWPLSPRRSAAANRPLFELI
jgi:hypothetical protein